MMQKRKRMIEEEEEKTGWINTEVLEGWKLLVKKVGDIMRYCDALMKDECVFVVEHAFAHLGCSMGLVAKHSRNM